MNKPKASPLPGRLPAQQLRQPGSVQPSKPVVAQPGKASSAPKAKHTVAPPVYRPQPKPVALQTKAASPKPPTPSSQSKHSPVAPPVYRPAQNKNVQPKIAATQPQALTGQTNRTPKAPPVYRPQPVPKVLQSKKADALRTPGPQQPAPPVQRPRQIPQAAQARTPHVQKPAEKVRKPAAPAPVMARQLPQTHGSNIQCRPASANGLQPPKQPLTSRSIAAQGRYTIQMVPIKVDGKTFDTKSESDTDELERRLNNIFRNNPNSRELEYIYRNIDPRESEDEGEYDRTIFIKRTLLGGMLDADRGYVEQIRTLNVHEWQSASCRIYVDGRELDILSWRNHGAPVQLSHKQKLEQSKADKQSIKNLKDDDGFQQVLGKKTKQDIQISAGDAEKQAIDQLRNAMATPSFIRGLNRANRDVYIRFVSFLGACDACKGRIQVLLQEIRAQVPTGIQISLSFFYQQDPKSKVRGKGIHTTYGWEEDVASTQRGFGGFYIHDFATVTGTWVAPPVVSSSSSASSSSSSSSSSSALATVTKK